MKAVVWTDIEEVEDMGINYEETFLIYDSIYNYDASGGEGSIFIDNNYV